MWVCSFCSNINKDSDLECIVCGQRKELREPSASIAEGAETATSEEVLDKSVAPLHEEEIAADESIEATDLVEVPSSSAEETSADTADKAYLEQVINVSIWAPLLVFIIGELLGLIKFVLGTYVQHIVFNYLYDLIFSSVTNETLVPIIFYGSIGVAVGFGYGVLYFIVRIAGIKYCKVNSAWMITTATAVISIIEPILIVPLAVVLLAITLLGGKHDKKYTVAAFLSLAAAVAVVLWSFFSNIN